MPNRTGNTKRKKRNEKSKKAELLQSGVTSVNVPCTSSTEASATSGGGEMSETKDGSAGYIKQIIIITIIGIIVIYIQGVILYCYIASSETKRDWLIHGHVVLDKCNVSLSLGQQVNNCSPLRPAPYIDKQNGGETLYKLEVYKLGCSSSLFEEIIIIIFNQENSYHQQGCFSMKSCNIKNYYMIYYAHITITIQYE